MKVYIGADHRGFELAGELYLWLSRNNVAVVNAGADKPDPADDFVDYAKDVGQRMAQAAGREDARGILICGSGVGMSIAANKIKGIRCCLGFDAGQVKAAKRDNDVNVLALPADFIDTEKAVELVKEFLETPFSGEERFKRRIEKIKQLEK